MSEEQQSINNNVTDAPTDAPAMAGTATANGLAPVSLNNITLGADPKTWSPVDPTPKVKKQRKKKVPAAIFAVSRDTEQQQQQPAASVAQDVPAETGGPPGSADNALVSEVAQQQQAETPEVLSGGGDTEPSKERVISPAEKTKAIFKDRVLNMAKSLFQPGKLNSLFSMNKTPEQKAALREDIKNMHELKSGWARRFK